MRYGVVMLLLLLLAGNVNAQFFKKLKDQVKNSAERKAMQKTDEAVNKAADKATDKKTYEKKDKDKKGSNEEPSIEPTDTKGSTEDATAPAAPSFSVFSKFDFIPGEKVLILEDFSSDAVGDFPAKWKTNASGEVVTVSGEEQRWLKLDESGVYMPEYMNNLPENFTLEMDVQCNPEFRYESSPLNFSISRLKTPGAYTAYMQGSGGREGFNIYVLPRNTSNSAGRVGYEATKVGSEYLQNRFETDRFHAAKKNTVKVSIWRQKTRVRVYLDEVKVIDVAQALDTNPYNALVFGMSTAQTKPDFYLISNIRLAVGAPDTRNKLITEGKFTTNGILFDVNSDRIKPESYAVLKEIGTVLKDNAGISVQIVGHTDSDGDATFNQNLSERRAASVKAALQKEFGIAESRMKTSGKGENEPVDKGTTSAAKANNRRVEFVKL